jgi:hypothetical protein
MKRFLISSTVIALFLAGAAFAAGAEFSADTRITAPGKTSDSKFFYAGDRWRMEESLPEGRRVTIFRQDLKVLYVLWPDKKRYIAQPLPEREFKILSTRKPGEEIERTELGREQVSDYPTIKYRVKYKVQGKEITVIEWFSDILGIVLRTEAEDKSISSLLSRIKQQKLDSKLFEIPADYRTLAAKDVIKAPQPTTTK